MARPDDVTIEKVLSEPGDPWGGGNGKSKMRTYDEVLFAGDPQTRKVFVPEHIDLAEGPAKGWFKAEKGTWTIADPNPPQGGGGGGSGGSDDYERRPDHPVQMQRALHTSCLSVAPAVIDGLLSRPGATQPQGAEDYFLLLAETVERLKAGYPKAVLDQAAKADA